MQLLAHSNNGLLSTIVYQLWNNQNHISIITTHTITLCFNLSRYKHLGGQGCETVQYWTVLRPIHHNYINQRPLFSPFQSVQLNGPPTNCFFNKLLNLGQITDSYLCNNQNHNNNHHLTNQPTNMPINTYKQTIIKTKPLPTPHLHQQSRPCFHLPTNQHRIILLKLSTILWPIDFN